MAPSVSSTLPASPWTISRNGFVFVDPLARACSRLSVLRAQSLVHFDDFETGATGWSDETRQVCGGNIVLGGYCKFAETEVLSTPLSVRACLLEPVCTLQTHTHTQAERTFVLPPHDFVRVTANFHFIDGVCPVKLGRLPKVSAHFSTHRAAQWKGEEGFLKLDQTIVWTESHLLCPCTQPSSAP